MDIWINCTEQTAATAMDISINCTEQRNNSPDISSLDYLTLEEGTDILSRNMDNQPQNYTT
jgi:hypothetical protein